MVKKSSSMIFNSNILIAMILFLAFTIGLNLGLHGLISIEIKSKSVQSITANNHETNAIQSTSNNKSLIDRTDNSNLNNNNINFIPIINFDSTKNSNLITKQSQYITNSNMQTKEQSILPDAIDVITKNVEVNDIQSIINNIIQSENYQSIVSNSYKSIQSDKSTKSSPITSYIQQNKKIPILLMTCNRPQLLSETISSLLSVRGVLKENIIVSQDGNNKEVSDIVNNNKLKLIQNTQGLNLRGGATSDGASRIAMHYKFSLTKAFEQFSNSPCIIIIEDDLLLSPDFYEYFINNANILELDESVFLLSAWNDNGFIDKAKDPYFLHRTEFFPGLGWLLPRQLYEKELERNWPNSHWDHWLRSYQIHKGREIVYPQVPRTYHNGIKGTFMNIETHNRYFRDINYNKNASISWINHYYNTNNIPQTVYTMKKVYDSRVQLLTSQCKHVTNIKDIISYNGEICCLWINVNPETNAEFEPIAKFFGIWHEHKRGSHRGLHEFYWRNNYILLFNVYDVFNIESYRHLRPDNIGLLQSNSFDLNSLSSAKPNNVHFTTIASDQINLNCEKVCRSQQKTCKKDYFIYINTCEELQRHFPCRDCIKSFGLEQPAYVNPVADMNAGKCLISSDISQSDCESTHHMTMRLCPCV